MGRFLNFVLFQAGWFAGVYLAGDGRPWIAALTLLAFAVAHVAMSRRRALELAVLLPCLPLGFLVDGLIASSGALEYRGAYRIAAGFVLPPLWILGMWLVFACTFRHSFRWIAGRPFLAAILGAVGGPLSYAAAARFSAVDVREPFARSILVVAASWAVALPLASWLAAAAIRRERVSIAVPAP
jgi:hypothetical protein